MSLLDRVNDEITSRISTDPVYELLVRIKRRAYLLQMSQGMLVEQALHAALEEEAFTLSEPAEHETRQEMVERKSLCRHLRTNYVPKKEMLSEERIREVLEAYRHLSDKQQLSTMVRRFKGRVDPSVVRRIIKERV